jgi:hypothetical protein
MRNYQKDSKSLILLFWIGMLFCAFIFSGCTKRESDTPRSGMGGALHKWIKSYQYNSSTGVMDTIRPLLPEDSVFILEAGYISVFKGERLIFRANVLERNNPGNDYFACGVLQSGWFTIVLEDSSVVLYRNYYPLSLTEIRFAPANDDYTIDYGCERVDLYDTEFLEF